MADEGNGRVSFTTKELLAEIKGDVKQVLIRMDDKADKAAVESHDRRITTIERHGSPGLEELRVKVEGNAENLVRIDLKLAEREYLVKDQDELGHEVDSLKSWRNRMVGAIAVIGPLSIIAAHYIT